MPRGDFEQHIPHCLVLCANRCGKRIPRSNIRQHDEECPNVQVPCSANNLGCNEVLLRSELLIHGQNCRYEQARWIIEPLQQQTTTITNELRSECDTLRQQVTNLTQNYQQVLQILHKMQHQIQRPTIRSDHRWRGCPNHLVTNNGRHVTKIDTGVRDWSNPIFSIDSIQEEITYIEFKIMNRALHFFFGVSKTTNVGDRSFMSPNDVICFYSDPDSLGSPCVTVVRDCSVRIGDVVGLVVDKTKQEIRFYKNGVLIARGTRSPSQMEPMYLVMWMYLGNAQVEFCEKYPFELLLE